MTERTLNVTNTAQAQKSISDIQVHGNPDMWVCLSKASSETQGWMKSTKALNVPGGIVLQVTTREPSGVAEALTFIPGTTVAALQEMHS